MCELFRATIYLEICLQLSLQVVLEFSANFAQTSVVEMQWFRRSQISDYSAS